MTKKVYKKAPIRKKSAKFFKKNGKELKSYSDYNAVFSLKKGEEESAVKAVEETTTPEPPNWQQNIRTKSKEIRHALAENISQIRKIKGENLSLEELKKMDKFKLSMISLGVNVALLIAVVFLVTKGQPSRRYTPKYSIFSSKPLTSLAESANLFGGDTRAATLDKILEAYNCPLAGHGKTFVKEADKNDIPYWLVASIAFQESGCGKVTPQVKKEGQEDVTDPEKLEFKESYNAWGWGVWGTNIKTFDSWEQGISAVSKYLGDSFFSKGITDTCVIMETYTPPSDGSWCKGVNYFGEMIQNYKTPQN